MKARLKVSTIFVAYQIDVRGSRAVTTFWQRTAQVKRDITAITLSSTGWYPAAAGILVGPISYGKSTAGRGERCRLDEFAADERLHGRFALRAPLDHNVEGDSLYVLMFAGRYARRRRFLLDMSFRPAELWRVMRSRERCASLLAWDFLVGFAMIIQVNFHAKNYDSDTPKRLWRLLSSKHNIPSQL